MSNVLYKVDYRICRMKILFRIIKNLEMATAESQSKCGGLCHALYFKLCIRLHFLAAIINVFVFVFVFCRRSVERETC